MIFEQTIFFRIMESDVINDFHKYEMNFFHWKSRKVLVERSGKGFAFEFFIEYQTNLR